MALIICPDCGKEFSDLAHACPNCGRPNNTTQYIKREKATMNKGKKFPFILAFVIVLTIMMVLILFKKGNSDDTVTLQVNGIPSDNVITVKANEIDIEHFDYDIKDDLIILKEYNGESETLEIKSSYTIDGISYKTDLSEFQVSNRKVLAIIFDDGIEEIKVSIFNGSGGINKIFFPNSINVIYDYTLAYLHPEEGNKVQIYYAGTESEWNKVFTEYTHVVGTDGLAETAGQAAADFLNGFIGVEYDSTNFEYYFSASINDIK